MEGLAGYKPGQKGEYSNAAAFARVCFFPRSRRIIASGQSFLEFCRRQTLFQALIGMDRPYSGMVPRHNTREAIPMEKKRNGFGFQHIMVIIVSVHRLYMGVVNFVLTSANRTM